MHLTQLPLQDFKPVEEHSGSQALSHSGCGVGNLTNLDMQESTNDSANSHLPTMILLML